MLNTGLTNYHSHTAHIHKTIEKRQATTKPAENIMQKSEQIGTVSLGLERNYKTDPLLRPCAEVQGYSGKAWKFGTSPNSWYQTALLDENMCAVGRMAITVSKHPAGTTSKLAI